MMKNVSESLASRVTILDLQGISLAEEQGEAENASFYSRGQGSLRARENRRTAQRGAGV